MKSVRFIAAAFVLFVLTGFCFAKEVERPDWVDDWRKLYPDTTYVAQMGKATGKQGANEAKTVAANTIAQYIKTNVQSELNSTLKTHSGSNKKGRLETSTERDNSQSITLSVDTTLTSLEFTEPWYNKKEKTWYCVAYVEREKYGNSTDRISRMLAINFFLSMMLQIRTKNLFIKCLFTCSLQNSKKNFSLPILMQEFFLLHLQTQITAVI